MNSKKTEIEVKVRVASLPAARRKLIALGARRESPRALERNLLFDSPAQELRRRGVLLRLRRAGRRSVLTMKVPAPGDPAFKVRAETEVEVGDFAAAEEIMHGIGLQPVFAYEKYREVLRLGRVRVMLDETPIGCFLEFEGAPAAIDAAAGRLGFSRPEYIRESYQSLFLQARGRGDMVFVR